MKYKTVMKAMAEARRFISLCEAYRIRATVEAGTGSVKDRACSQTKEAGSVKRASMDVTRAMAELRMDR